MNDGTVALLIQWCFLCLVWMGNLDQSLHALGFSRRSGIALLCAYLVCSFAEWKLYVLPVYVYVGGVILPVLTAGWLWLRLTQRQKLYAMSGAVLYTVLFYLVQKLVMADPVLLIWDRHVMLPLLYVLCIQFSSRDRVVQWFILLLSVPLSDVFLSLQEMTYRYQATLGGAEEQDMFWTTTAIWATLNGLWAWGMKLRPSWEVKRDDESL